MSKLKVTLKNKRIQSSRSEALSREELVYEGQNDAEVAKFILNCQLDVYKKFAKEKEAQSTLLMLCDSSNDFLLPFGSAAFLLKELCEFSSNPDYYSSIYSLRSMYASLLLPLVFMLLPIIAASALEDTQNEKRNPDKIDISHLFYIEEAEKEILALKKSLIKRGSRNKKESLGQIGDVISLLVFLICLGITENPLILFSVLTMFMKMTVVIPAVTKKIDLFKETALKKIANAHLVAAEEIDLFLKNLISKTEEKQSEGQFKISLIDIKILENFSIQQIGVHYRIKEKINKKYQYRIPEKHYLNLLRECINKFFVVGNFFSQKKQLLIFHEDMSREIPVFNRHNPVHREAIEWLTNGLSELENLQQKIRDFRQKLGNSVKKFSISYEIKEVDHFEINAFSTFLIENSAQQFWTYAFDVTQDFLPNLPKKQVNSDNINMIPLRNVNKEPVLFKKEKIKTRGKEPYNNNHSLNNIIPSDHTIHKNHTLTMEAGKSIFYIRNFDAFTPPVQDEIKNELNLAYESIKPETGKMSILPLERLAEKGIACFRLKEDTLELRVGHYILKIMNFTSFERLVQEKIENALAKVVGTLDPKTGEIEFLASNRLGKEGIKRYSIFGKNQPGMEKEYILKLNGIKIRLYAQRVTNRLNKTVLAFNFNSNFGH